MSTARDRVLDLLAGSDGLHRLADAGDVVWAGSGVTLPGTDRQEAP